MILEQVLWRSKDDHIYLTFDDGPDPEITPPLLDVLQQHHIPATFFLVGKKAEHHPEIVRRISEAGHTIGNHSYNHIRLLFQSASEIQFQIQATDDILAAITGHKPSLFRPPYGKFGPNLLHVTAQTGHRVVMWNHSAKDYKRDATRKSIEARLQKIKPGNIVLLHDGIRQSRLTLAALENALKGLRISGHQFAALQDHAYVADL